MRKVEIVNRNLKLTDELIGFVEKRVTSFGTGAKVDCPKQYLGRRTYLLIVKD